LFTGVRRETARMTVMAGSRGASQPTPRRTERGPTHDSDRLLTSLCYCSAMSSCAAPVLIAFLAVVSLAATRRVTPETMPDLRKDPPAPGDTVLFADGRYEGLWLVNSRDVTYRAEGDGALFETIYLQPGARNNRFERLRQAGSTAHFGIAVQGHGNVFRDVSARDNPDHGFLFRCMSEDDPCRWQRDPRLPRPSQRQSGAARRS
jgi:hypothetical protein